MAEGTTDGPSAPGEGRKRRSINWIGSASALAALLSAVAAMTTAATGIWHPPVPIPVIQAKVTWVGPTSAAAQPTAAQSAGATPRQAPSPTPSPSGYQADWTSGMGGWVGADEWKTVAAMLISDGHSRDSYAAAGLNSVRPPFRPASPDYTVTARLKIVSDPQQYPCDVALLLRVAPDGQGQETHGYSLGYAQGTGAVIASYHPGTTTTISHATFSPGNDWHEYAAAVKDNLLTLGIDGSTVLQASDNNYLDAGQVGLMSDACQVQVSSFTVTPL